VTERLDPSAHNALVRYWCDTYEQHVGAKYPFQGGKDGKTIKWLREMYEDDDIQQFMTGFFEIEDDFIQNSGYSLGVFRGTLPKVIQFVKRDKQQPKSKAPSNLRGIEQWMLKRASGE
jgi:hypothetical protein